MRRRLRPILIYVLLILLPLHAAAAVAANPCAGMQKSDCKQMMSQAMDCCDGQGGSSGHGQPAGSCGAWSACAASYAPAMPPAVCDFAFAGRTLTPPVYVSLQYISFIAEGLQRPPSIPA